MADVHRLYVYKAGVASQNAAEKRARDATIEILQYVQRVKPTLQQMGVSLKIIPLTRKVLANADVRRRLQAVFRTSNGSSVKAGFPALRTPADSYVGVANIRQVYDTNIQAYHKHRGGGQPIVDEDDDPLSAFYKGEMTAPGADHDRLHKEETVGEENVMMSSYRDMMKRRDARRPPKKAPTPPGAAPHPSKKKTGPVVPKRAGNVAGDDNPLDALDMLEGNDPGGDAADDHMMRSFLENLEES